jgi:hypothetical protein
MGENSLYFMQIILIISFLIWLFIIGRIFFFYFVTIKKWNKTEATIICSEMEWFRSKTDSDNEGWKQIVKYEYYVNDVKYENNCVTKNIGFLSPFKDFAKKYSFTKGQKIQIAYNSISPNNSIIDDRFDFSTLIIPIVFYILLCIFLF